MKLFQPLLSIAMFTSVARAFSVTGRMSAVSSRFTLTNNSGRFFMSTGSNSDPAAGTSIVAICQEKIQKALEADSVKVTGKSKDTTCDVSLYTAFFLTLRFSPLDYIGAYDDPNGSHISIEVVSSKFEGKRPMQRQQLVYKAIWEEMQGPVHAVDSMTCKTPNELNHD
jgi:stress-induced morphogen